MKKIRRNKKGFALLIAILTTSMLLIVSFVVVNVALKQILLSDSNKESQYAFYAADSGTECALYWDFKDPAGSPFDSAAVGSIACNGQAVSTDSQTVSTVPSQPSVIGGGGPSNPTSIFQINYTKGCAIVRVTKLPNGDTTIDSKGYNTCNTSALRRLERGVTITYNDPTPQSSISPEATCTPPETSIVDALGNTWTYGPGPSPKEVLKNGVPEGGARGVQLLWFEGNIYDLGADENWYLWTNSGGWPWTNTGTAAPGPCAPVVSPATYSPDGTCTPPETSIIDDYGNTWTFAPGPAPMEVLKNGVAEGGARGLKMLYTDRQIYDEGADGNWYLWTNSGGFPWANMGPVIPAPCVTGGPGPSASPDGTCTPPETSIIDSGGNTWTYAPGPEPMEVRINGVWDGMTRGTLLMWVGGEIYDKGGDYWYKWLNDGSYWPWENIGMIAPGECL